jgi:lipooligosaccharide transport system ATP-binding protein
MEPVVIAESLVKHYGRKPAVQGVSFAVNPGECYGFLGPNGAGKTTVMRMIYCFMPPTSGTLRVLGMDVMHDPSAIKARLGVMPQDDNLDPDLSSMENLMVYARYFGITAPRSRPRAMELLRFVELEAEADVNVEKLSGGMRRRLLLARSLLNEPALVVLDEPTTGMDPHSRRTLWGNLEALKSRGTSVVLTTHYMEEAERICDRVAIMDHGLIVEVDSPSALMHRHGGNLEEVYLKLTGARLAE